MKKWFSLLIAVALMISMMAAAQAAVSFDPETGTGFVGKGDVQTAMGWNNHQLQQNAGSLSFTFETVETYAVTVTWVTGEGTRGEKIHYVTHKRTSTVAGNVAYDGRTMKQITGFNLTGFAGVPTVEGSIPNVGDVFPGSSGHEVIAVELVSELSTSTIKVNGVALQ